MFRNKLSLPIRAHLAVLCFLVAAPLLIAAAFYAQRSVRLQQETLGRVGVETVTQAASGIERELEAAKAALFSLSLSRSLRDDDLRSFHEQVTELAKKFTGSVIALRRPDGTQVLASVYPFGTTLTRTLDAALLKTDADAARTRETLVGDLFVGTLTGQSLVSVVQPVILNDEVKYLLTLALPTDRFLSILRATSLSDDWLLALVDRNYRVITRTREPARFVGAMSTPDYIAATKAKSGSFPSVTLDGIASLVTFTHVTSVNWIVSAAVPYSVLNAPAEQAKWVMIGSALLAITTGALLALGYGAVLARAIFRVRDGALAVGAGRRVPPTPTHVSELDIVQSVVARSSEDIDRLINELNHRVKNSLAMVQSIVSQTLATTKDIDEFRKAFEGRLRALSASYDILTARSWQVAGVHDIVSRACGAFAGNNRATLVGDNFDVNAKAAMALSMIVHELCTNATKYGSLSVPGGTVVVSWALDADNFVLEWKEIGGPPAAEPTRSGFGKRLIEANIEGPLEGTCTMIYGPNGFRLNARGKASAVLPKPGE